MKKTVLASTIAALLGAGCNEVQAPTALIEQTAASTSRVPSASLAASGTMDVASLGVGWVYDVAWKRKGHAVVTIRDQAGAPVVGATVRGRWSGCSADTASGVTIADDPSTPADEGGVAQLYSKAVSCGNGNKPCSWTFQVTDLSHPELSWDPLLYPAPLTGNSGCCAPLGPPCH